MTRTRFSRRWAFTGAVLAGLLNSGCAHEWAVDKKTCKNEKCQILEKGAIPQPNGTFTRSFLSTQAGRAEVDDFVVYRYEWANDSDKLNDYGERHLLQLARRLQEGPSTVLLEDSGNKAMNAQRLATVINTLSMAGLSDAPARVMVGTPEAEGLYGDEMQNAYGQLVGNGAGGTGSGSSGGVGVGGGSNFGGGTFGGTGGAFGGGNR